MQQHERMLRLHQSLRLATWLVPQQQREAWRQEWIAELTVLLRESPHAAQHCTNGLLADALTMRQIAMRNRWRAIDWRSPKLCIRLLVGIFAVLSTLMLNQPYMHHLVISRWGALTFAMFALLAIFSIPSTIVVSRFSACDPYKGDAASARKRASRWAFLTAKLVLLIPINYLLTVQWIAIVYWVTGLPSEFFVVWFGVLFNVIAIGWAFNDQRDRCPTCMRLLRSPAYMGTPSWNLLHTNATEELCDRGHGLLHQPHWQTSWCNNARWLQLDATWRELFHP